MLNSADIRKILADYFKIDEKQVVPNRYSFSIKGEVKEHKEVLNEK